MAGFGNFWNGAVAKFKVLCIFVLAWCWVFATIFKPRNVKCNIFSELTLNASLLFFRYIISKNVAEKFCVISEIWTEPCRKTLCWKYIAWNQALPTDQVCVTMESRKRTLRINVTLFIKFRKYKTAFNSGLKIWLVRVFLKWRSCSI